MRFTTPLLGLVCVFAACKKQSITTDTTIATSFQNVAIKASSALGAAGIAGESWADSRDNFVDAKLVLKGLDSTDTYAMVQAKAENVLTIFQSNGANTVRVPINYPTVNSAWWNSYNGAIDKALSKGMKVIICFWDSNTSHNGQIDNTTQFYSAWTTVINKYSSNANVFFEIFNEPSNTVIAQPSTLWVNLAAQWLNTYPNIPRNRILVSGTPSVSSDVTVVGADSRFNGCLLALHFYRFFYYNLRPGQTVFKPELQTVPQWEALLQTKIGAYASRTVITEFGDNMTPPAPGEIIDYNGSPNGDIRTAAMQAITNKLRNLQMGSVIWAGYGQGGYDLNVILGSTGTPNNVSALQQVQYGWGAAAPVPTFDPTAYYKIVNVNSSHVLDVSQGSLLNNAALIQYPYNAGTNQQWKIIAVSNQCFKLVNRKSGKVIDVTSSSQTAGAGIIQYTDYGGDNQQWQITEKGAGVYEISNRNSSQALDVNGGSSNSGAGIVQNPWNTILDNQKWQIIKL